jgi:hypothetical protein
VNSAAITMAVQHISVLFADKHSFGYMPRSGTTESHHSYIFTFYATEAYSGSLLLREQKDEQRVQ